MPLLLFFFFLLSLKSLLLLLERSRMSPAPSDLHADSGLHGKQFTQISMSNL